MKVLTQSWNRFNISVEFNISVDFLGADYMENFSPVDGAEILSQAHEQIPLKLTL